MKKNQQIYRHAGLLLAALLLLGLFSACTKKGAADPPVLSHKWITVYDDKAEGISKEWFLDFPGGNISGSTWDDWQIKNARYRWHKQSFYMGVPDSSAHYFLKCSMIAGKNLVWINGELLDELNISTEVLLDITNHLKAEDYNNIVIRSEFQEDAFGINKVEIIKGSAKDAALPAEQRDYSEMPLYDMPPSYANGLVIYQADIRHMSDAANLSGFRNTISRLDQLGVNMVWLKPLHPVGNKNRRGQWGSPYAVKDHFLIHPTYGDLSDFNSIITLLKRYKIRTMLELVPGQSSADHAWISDYPDYYKNDGKASSDIKKFNFDSGALQKRMFSYFDFWLERGPDAFCCYDSHTIPGIFWQDLRDHFQSLGKDPFMLADAADPEMMLNGFNAVQSASLHDTFKAIANKESDASAIGSVLAEEMRRYPEGTLVLHYTENDKTERAAELLGEKGHHLALFTIFSAPGIPMLYCGEELINPPKLDPYNKTEMNWYHIHWPTYNLISKLSKLRRSSAVLTRGNFSQIADTKSIGGFMRSYKGETWFVLMNYSDKTQIYQCDVRSTVFSDGVSGLIQNGRVQLQPYGYCIVK